jgi:YHS domain-containing protein
LLSPLEFESVIVKDPVCGMPLDSEKANFKAEFLTKKYFF